MRDWIQGPPPLAGLPDDALSARHLTLQRDIRRLRVAVPLLVLCILAATALHIRATFHAIEADAVGAAFEKQALRVLPKVQRVAAEVGEEVAPMVGDAFARQLDAALERLSGRLDSEMTLLGEELQKTLQGQIERRLQRVNGEAVAQLGEAFPQLRGDPKRVERLMVAFQEGFSAWAGKTLTTTFARHLKELDAIKRTLNGFVREQNLAERKAKADAAAEGRHSAKRRITPDQLLALWLEILDEALKGDGGGDSDLFAAPVEAPPAAKGKAGG
jgi:hypothetical protein